MHTFDSLIQDLQNAGIDPNGTLLCHLSMKKIGQVEGGADTVLDALMAYMARGLLVIPCHTWSNVDDRQPVFDARRTPACIGLLPEMFRHRPGVVRSNHPTHSVCAFGRDAKAFCAGQERFDTPCSPDSCYGMLEKRNAQVMLVGVNFSRNTSIHCIEEVARVPNRLSAGYHNLFWTDENGQVHALPSLRHENADSGRYIKLEPVMLHRKQLRNVKFGDADTMLFRERDLFSTTLELLEKDIDLFGDDRPIPSDWY